MKVNSIELVVSLMVMGLLAAGVALPLIAGITMETVSVSNEGAGWVRMAYGEGADYDVTITNDGTTVTAATLSGAADTDTILYADSAASVMCVNGSLVCLYQDGTETKRAELGANVTIQSTGGDVTISDGTTTVNVSPEWAYYPDAEGAYSCFASGNLNVKGKPLAAGGSFAGVVAYNELVNPDVGLSMQAEADSELITSVKWAVNE